MTSGPSSSRTMGKIRGCSSSSKSAGPCSMMPSTCSRSGRRTPGRERSARQRASAAPASRRAAASSSRERAAGPPRYPCSAKNRRCSAVSAGGGIAGILQSPGGSFKLGGMTRREVRWERMLPHELEAAFAACPAVYFGYGLREPHGPHCALGLDGLKAHGLLVRTARRHGGIVAPADFWHVHELGGYALWAEREIGEARPWLTAVPPWVHFKKGCFHVPAAEGLGFHPALLLSRAYRPEYFHFPDLCDRFQT